MKEFLESLKQDRDKRIFFIGSSVIGLLGLIIAAVVIFYPEKEEELPTDFSVSKEEADNIDSFIEDFIKDSGKLGVENDSLNGNNVRDMRDLAVRGDSDFNISQSRYDNYLNLTDRIYSGSPLDYDTREVATWSLPRSNEELWSFEVTAVQSEVPDEGFFMELDGKRMEAVEVPVSFNSTQTKRIQTGNDTEWDGSFSVLEKDFIGNTADLRLVKNGDHWEIYDATLNDNPFLLSIWENPSMDGYENTQFNFDQIEVLTPDEDHTPQKIAEEEAERRDRASKSPSPSPSPSKDSDDEESGTPVDSKSHSPLDGG